MAICEGRRRVVAVYLLTACAPWFVACNGTALRWPWTSRPAPGSTARPTPAGSPATPTRPDDHPLTLVGKPAPASTAAARTIRFDVALTTLLVQIPRRDRTQTEAVWNHLREDVFDGRTALRLRQNGLRVGVGRAEWWEAVQTVLNSVPAVRSNEVTPVRVPPNYPLALELDTAPREQTLFFASDDGVLSGETWPQSRNVLRVSYELNLHNPERVRLVVVPEVRQHLDGWSWVKTDTGLAQVPNYAGRTFATAGFAAELEPGEFLLVAPTEASDGFGLIGSTFLTTQEDEQRFESFVFLRADVNRIAQRN